LLFLVSWLGHLRWHSPGSQRELLELHRSALVPRTTPCVEAVLGAGLVGLGRLGKGRVEGLGKGY